ncbi:hypothetical protein [Microbacterium sp. GXF0217]
MDSPHGASRDRRTLPTISSFAIAYREAGRARRVVSIALSILTIVLSIGILAIFLTRPEIFLSMGMSALTGAEQVVIGAREYLLFLPMIALGLLIRMPRPAPPARSTSRWPLTLGIIGAALCLASYVYPQAVVLISGLFFFVGVLSTRAG